MNTVPLNPREIHERNEKARQIIADRDANPKARSIAEKLLAKEIKASYDRVTSK